MAATKSVVDSFSHYPNRSNEAAGTDTNATSRIRVRRTSRRAAAYDHTKCEFQSGGWKCCRYHRPECFRQIYPRSSNYRRLAHNTWSRLY
ncbi:hypothetical protein AGR7B_Lc10002 [Agrobacterium deltaense RV3]|nr:hypothetical protein AGR7B_Lc10002 [Agrobacterium deltaense RV3]